MVDTRLRWEPFVVVCIPGCVAVVQPFQGEGLWSNGPPGARAGRGVERREYLVYQVFGNKTDI